MADLSGLDELINPEDKKDYSQMMNDSYIDPAEEIKPQPVAISVGSSIYKGSSFAIPNLIKAWSNAPTPEKSEPVIIFFSISLYFLKLYVLGWVSKF